MGAASSSSLTSWIDGWVVNGRSAAGIPKFFRWVAERYPLTLSHLGDDSPPVEIDNLYLDMNGIIHNCTHANQSKTTSTEEKMIFHVFSYIERLVRIAKPCQLLFMAIDGMHLTVHGTNPDQFMASAGSSGACNTTVY